MSLGRSVCIYINHLLASDHGTRVPASRIFTMVIVIQPFKTQSQYLWARRAAEYFLLGLWPLRDCFSNPSFTHVPFFRSSIDSGFLHCGPTVRPVGVQLPGEEKSI